MYYFLRRMVRCLILNQKLKQISYSDTEAGFKDALTGLYINMTSKDVYGANLSWQAIEFIGRTILMEGKALILNYRNTISNTILRRILSKRYGLKSTISFRKQIYY